MNLLLIPTTNHIITSWSEVYNNFTDNGHKVYTILDNKFINKEFPSDFIKLELFAMRLHQLDQLSSMQKLFIVLYLNIYAKQILKKYSIDTIVVSNDNALVANIFINNAKKLNKKTILHQAAGVLNKPIKISFLQQLKLKLKTFMFNLSSSPNIGNDVDLCLLQGEYWAKYIDNKNYKIVGNDYFRTFNKKIKSIKQTDILEFKKNINLGNKKLVVFFSQPSKELKMASDKNIKSLYNDIKYLETKLLENDDYLFIFKPHPQEYYYKEFNFKNIIKDIDINLLVASSDICLTIFSTMAIQSKIAGKKTLGYLPDYFDDNLVNYLKSVFDFHSNNIENILKSIFSDVQEQQKDFSKLVDLSLNTKELVYKELI